MKTIKRIALLMLTSIFTTASFTACSSDDELTGYVSNSIQSYNPAQDVQVIEMGYMGTEVSAEALTRAANGELNPEDKIFNTMQKSWVME